MWDDVDRRFYREPTYFRFPHTYKFEETEVGDRLQYNRISLTLNEVWNGNVQVVRIGPEEFWPHGLPVQIRH
jgi:hypothetical protein